MNSALRVEKKVEILLKNKGGDMTPQPFESSINSGETSTVSSGEAIEEEDEE